MTSPTPTLHGPATQPPAPAVLRRIVELAGRAPSVRNTQPWRWRAVSDGLELSLGPPMADHGRRLRCADPVDRNPVISCGAGLHHAELAANALGWDVEVDRSPDGASAPLLARLRFSRGPVPPTEAAAAASAASAASAAIIRVLEERYTDRRRFTTWPVPDDRLQSLVRIAGTRGAHAVAVLDVADRFRVGLLVSRALRRTPADPVRPDQPTRLPQEPDVDVTGSDGLLVLHSVTDDVESWLRAGEGLSALWLHAADDGLSVVPLSRVIDVAETRVALEHQVLGGLAHPLLLVRIGWRAISRGGLPRTPRRPWVDVPGPR